MSLGCKGIALILLAASTAAGQPVSPAAKPGAAAVAVFYDGVAKPLSEGYLDAHDIRNLLGHFGLEADIFPIAGYRPGQLAHYRAGFFAGTVTGTRFPPGFLADVRASQQPFCWIGRHIGSLVSTPEGRRQFGFTYEDYRDDLEFREVSYKGVTLPKEDPDLNIISITDPAVEVLATATNDEHVTRPYVVRRNRFWYFADQPFSFSEEGDRYLVFCDLLHDILEINHPAQARVLVRIEDVSTEIDPGDLRAVADLLAARRVPFQIAVIPIFRNPAKGFEVYLSDRQSLVDAIHYMVARGGTPVMHGTTHQYRGASGDDYEFWDDVAGRPVLRDSPKLVLDRLQQGLAECFANGIFPVAYETPHYGASEADYRTMAQVFSLFYERTMATPDIGAIQYFPYPVVDEFGRYVVPENLGYVPADNLDPKPIIERAKNLRVVRDAVASFYFHPFLDPALLAEIVRGVREAGYQFVSLREFGGGVNDQGRYLVRTSSGAAEVAPHGEFWRLRLYDRTGKLTGEKISKERLSGLAKVDVQVPAGGWAAVECAKEPPKKAAGLAWPVASWKARLAAWRGRLHPARRWLDTNGDFAVSHEAWLLWLEKPSTAEEHNQQSYRAALETFGYRVKTISNFPALPPPDSGIILVVPEGAGARWNEAQQKQLLGWLEAGGMVVADGRQPWLSSLGFRWSGHRIEVAAVVDVLFPEMPLQWQPPESIERFTAPAGAQELMVDSESKQALALAGRHGSGRYLYLAAPLDPHSGDALSHYPYFAEYMDEGFRLRPAPRSPRLEIYFDPGFREGASVDRLVSSWRQWGVRAVYASAWQFYRQYTYDYDKLIAACHHNGIAVYAWFVLPQVTVKIWEEHPEWREKTASGADGRVGWRYAMNLENPACFRAATDWMQALLSAHDWDGVNVSELNFDADIPDYLRPDKFVPMNSDVRAEFRAREGFDPALLFAPGSPYYHQRNPEALGKFLGYRQDIVTRWHERVLGAIEPLARERGWEVIVTMLDSLHSRYVGPALGVDSRRIVDLMRRFDFTLQVEDPAEHWTAPPDRYRRFAETYRRLVADPQRLMFDINVVPDRGLDGSTLPSATATGTELARTVVAAASVSGRAAIYAESTVPSQDWKLIGEALAATGEVEPASRGWKVQAPVPLLLTSSEDRDYYLDGRLWPAISPEGLLAPPGAHRLSAERPWFQLFERGDLPLRLLDVSGELLDAQASRTGLEIRYRSPSRAVLLLNQKPREMFVDGARVAGRWEPAGGGNWAVLAPRGRHEVRIEILTRAGVFVNAWGWMSGAAIAAFGALSTALMALIYFQIRMRRLARRGGAV